MGAVQRLATMVIVGLVALSTILVLYLADEDNRIKAEEEEQQEAAIERATANYISLCLSCHGPAGQGYAGGDGRIGAPLNTSENQQGVNAQGTPVSGGVEARADIIRTTIHEGRPGTLMPAWGEENSGPLNNEQINELVTMIQHVDWNEVYNQAVEESGGYPTAPPAATTAPEATEAPAQPNTYNVEMVDIAFAETELIVPANTEITINLTNTGAGPHNFTIDELGVASSDLPSGGTETITFNTGAPAEYEYYCSIPGHREAGMVGKLLVTDDPARLPQPASEAQEPPEGAGEGQAPAPDNASNAATEFNVEMVDIAFAETELTVPANTDITINLTNTGAATHNFTITELNVASSDLGGGQSEPLTFNTGAPGTYQYFCSIPGHKEAGMVGTLTVQ